MHELAGNYLGLADDEREVVDYINKMTETSGIEDVDPKIAPT